MGKVIAFALALTVGPIGWGMIAVQIFKFLFFTVGLSFAEANAISIAFISFPFFLGGAWVLFNMPKWDSFLKRILP